jgi:hypothetical protein
MSDVLVFLICIVLSAALFLLSVYILLLIGDIDYDYSNTKLGCARLNFWVLPELAGTLAMSLILVFTYHWMLFIATLPYSGILLHKYLNIPPGNVGLYDPTVIRNRGLLRQFQREAYVKIGYHLIECFVLIYNFSIAMVF